MEPDLALVIGLVIAGFSIPSMMSAVTDGRAPRASALTILISFALIFYAVYQKPSGYSMSEIPDAFVNVMSQFFR
jgi:hypothetical protein